MTVRVGTRVRATIEGEVYYVYPTGGEDADGREFVHIRYDDVDGDAQKAPFVDLADVVEVDVAVQIGDYLTAEELAERDAPVGTVINDDDAESVVWRFAKMRGGRWAVLSADGGDDAIDADDLESYAITAGAPFYVEYVPALEESYADDNVVALTA